MRITSHQLGAQLQKALLPAYLITGDEILLRQEAADAVRATARQQGCGERLVFDAGGSDDWQALLAAGRSLSLFAQRQILEMRLPRDKVDDHGQHALLTYLEDPSPDNVLLITAPKLDKGVSKHKWFNRLLECGVVVTATPLKNQELPAWIQARARAAGLQLDREAIALLAERNEGNLLAAAQEITKLQLLLTDQRGNAQDVAQAVANSARFSVFDLVDTCLAGNPRRVLRLFRGLHAEGVAPVQILWWLTRDLRNLAGMHHAVTRGATVDRVLTERGVWDSRKPLFRKALTKAQPDHWQTLLERCAALDRRAKGFDTGNLWDDLLELALQMS